MDRQTLRARYPEAFAYLAARGVEPSDAFYARLEQLRGQAWTVAKLQTIEQIDHIKNTLVKALQQGQSFRDWQKTLTPAMLALPKHYRETVFRNAVQSSYNGAKWAHFRDNPNRPILRYVAVNDHRTRPAHHALHGLMMPVDDPRWQTLAPSNGHNCFLPHTQVQGEFEIGLKSFYSGEAVEITTRAGNCFAVTANHPVLTDRGWVDAHEIKEGDNLLTNRVVVNSPLSAVFDDQYPPTFAEDAFKSLCGDGMGIADVAAFQFHGDTQLREREVHIAGADALLLDGAQPMRMEGITEQKFIIADASLKRKVFLDGNRAAELNIGSVASKTEFAYNPPNITSRTTDQTRHFTFAAVFRVLIKADNFLRALFRLIFGGTPSGGALAFDATGDGFNLPPFHRFSFTLPTANNATGAQALLDNLSADPMQLGESVFTLPGGVGFDDGIYDTIRNKTAGFSETEVLLVRHFFYRGHVYDFQTKNGIILADGVVVHNCRCTLMSLSEKQARAFGYDGAPKDLPTWTDKHGHEHTCAPDKGWAHSPENSDLTAYLREREEKAGLSRAVFDGSTPNTPKPYTPPLDGTPESQIRYDIITRGQAESVEYAAIIGEGGLLLAMVRGEANRVSFPPDVLEKMRGATLYHNHPSAASLSAADINLAADYGLREIIAFGTYERAEYSIVLKKAAMTVKAITFDVSEGLKPVMRAAHNSGRLSYNEALSLHAHVTNLILHKKGVIKYTPVALDVTTANAMQAHKEWIKEIMERFL